MTEIFGTLKDKLQGKLERFRVLYPRATAKCIGEMPVYRLEDRASESKWTHANIPGVLYQTSDSNLLGKTHYREVMRFRSLNPGVHFRFFDRSMVDLYMRTNWGGHPLLDIYERAFFGPLKADIFRYCILWQRGGIYCDIKSRFIIPIADLLTPRAEVVVAYENRFANVAPSTLAVRHLQHPQHLALQWALIVSPGHPILRYVLESIVEQAVLIQGLSFQHPQAAICRFTGPGCYTQALWSWVSTANDLSGLQQAGIDFEGRAEYRMPGSWSRWALNPHYSLANDCPIIASSSES